MSAESLLSAWDLITQHGRSGIVALLILLLLLLLGKLVVILLDEDRCALFRARIYRLGYWFTGRTDQEKKYIANDIKGRLNLARRALCYSKEAPATAIDVTWVEGGSGYAHDIKEGEFIVRLDPSNEQEKNIALFATAVAKRTTMLGIRHSVARPLQTAIELNIARNLLQLVGNRPALDWF
jgi:hypothetical protein